MKPSFSAVIALLIAFLIATASWSSICHAADNGPELYAYARDAKFDHWSARPFRNLKRDIYEGGQHVPFLIRWPGVTEPGQVSRSLVSQIDIMATLAGHLHFAMPDSAAEDSHDLMPILKDAAASVRMSHVHNTHQDKYAIRDGDWSLIDTKNGYTSRRDPAWEKKHDDPADDNGPVEFYDLSIDVGQRNNLASQHPDRVAEMQALLKTIRTQGHSAPWLDR